MNWTQILNKVGVTSFRTDLSETSELQFNVLRSPVLCFLNDVGLIVVPSEVLPSSLRLRALHRYLFVGISVVLFGLAIYIRFSSVPPAVVPSQPGMNLPSSGTPITPVATGTNENQTNPSAIGQLNSHEKAPAKHQITAYGHSEPMEQQLRATVIQNSVPTKRESITATQNSGNLAPTIKGSVAVVATPDRIWSATVTMVGPHCKRSTQESYRIDVCVWSEGNIGDEALNGMLAAVVVVVDGSALSAAMKDGAFIQFLVSSTGATKPESLYVKLSAASDPKLDMLKKVIADAKFPASTLNEGPDWDVTIVSNNVQLVPEN